MVAFFIIGWVLLAVAVALTFDKLICLEYRLHRREWEKDGRPSGIFWSPPEVKRAGLREFVGGTFYRRRVGPAWLFSTPAWIKQRREARTWLYAFRVLYLADYLLPIGAFVYLIWVT